MKYTDSLRGYSHETHRRDGFRCVYCGLDGTEWPTWLFLSRDHLVPPGHQLRDDPNYIVTACRFCNECCNRTVFDVQGKSPAEIVTMKRIAIQRVRNAYHEFWATSVRTR